MSLFQFQKEVLFYVFRTERILDKLLFLVSLDYEAKLHAYVIRKQILVSDTM